MACNIQFLCSRKWSKGKDKHCPKFFPPLSQNQCRQTLISCLVCFNAQLNFGVWKNIAPVPSFVYNSKEREKPKTPTQFLSYIIYQEHSPQIWAKTEENLLHANLKRAPISWKYSFEKKSKTVSETFLQLNEIKTTRCENSYLQFTNKRLNLLHNNSTQMLTRQDVKHCSVREFDSTFQVYQALLSVACSEGKVLL